MAEIPFEFTGNQKSAEAALAALERKYDKLENKIKRTAETSKRGSASSREALRSVGRAVTSQIAGYVSLTSVMSGAAAAAKEINREAEEAALKIEDLTRKFRVQGGLTALEADTARASITQVAVRNAFTSEQAFGAATQLVSSGFSAEQAQGGALNEFLRILNASNQSGKQADPAQMALAISAYAKSQGRALNADTVRDVGVPIQRLFQGTDIQLPDLQEFAKQAVNFQGKLTQEEQFATLAQLKDVGLPGGEATTAMRNFVAAVSSQKLRKKKARFFEMAGINPDDIDLQGENLDQVLGRVEQGINSVAPELRESLMAQIFDKANVAAVKTLLANRQGIQDKMMVQRDVAGFDAAVAAAMEGQGPSITAMETATEALTAERDREIGLFRAALKLQARKEGVSGFTEWFARSGFETAAFFGASGEGATRFTLGAGGSADEVVRLTKDTNEVLRSIDTKMMSPKINRDAHTE